MMDQTREEDFFLKRLSKLIRRRDLSIMLNSETQLLLVNIKIDL